MKKLLVCWKKKGYKNIYHLQGGILQYLNDIPEEENLFEGECYVFDKRVALNQELEKGSYSICHACGMPVSIQDQKRNCLLYTSPSPRD